MRTRLLAMALVATAFLTCFSGVEAEESKPIFWSLAGEGDKTPSGHLVVRVSRDGAAPSDWDLNWFVSIHSPKGLRLPLGYLEDRGSFVGDPLALKLPPGTYTIEITRPRPSSQSLGQFDLGKGRWIPSDREAILVGKKNVSVHSDQVHVLSITYRGARVMSKKEGEATTHIFTWDKLAIVSSSGQVSDLPKKEAKPYPLLQGVSLEALDQSQAVSGLRLKEGIKFAETVLLHAKTPLLEPILTGLSDKSITLSWRLARVLKTSHEVSVVSVLSGILKDQSTEPDPRAAAAWALGEPEFVGGLTDLKNALRDPDTMVRNYAVLSLGQVKAPAVVPSLVEATHDTRGQGGATVFVTLEELPGIYAKTKERPKIFAIEPIPFYSVRMNAIYSLGQVVDPAAVEVLIGLLDDPDDQVRLTALQGLGNYAEPRVVEALKAKLNDQQSIRFIAVHLLSRLGDAGVLSSLDTLAREDPDELVRQAAGEAFREIRRRLEPPKKSEPKKKQHRGK